MQKDVKKILRSVGFALKGFAHAYRADKSFRMEIKYGLPIYIIVAYFLSPLTSLEWLFFIFSYALILLVELINTAFEKMLDRLHPEEHELIGRSKDIAATAVLLAFIFAIVVVCVLASARFMSAYTVGG